MMEKEERAKRVAAAMGGRPIAWLAREVGVALSTAHSYVGGAVPPADIAIRVADALGIAFRWYIAGEASPATRESGMTDVPLVDHSFRPVGSVGYSSGLLEGLASDTAEIRCLLARGAAMRPTVPEHAEVLFGPMNGEPEDGGVYVLAVGGKPLVRRVMKAMDGNWLAVCDNPAFRLEEKERVPADSFVGQVLWVSHRP